MLATLSFTSLLESLWAKVNALGTQFENIGGIMLGLLGVAWVVSIIVYGYLVFMDNYQGPLKMADDPNDDDHPSMSTGEYGGEFGYDGGAWERSLDFDDDDLVDQMEVGED